MFILTLACLTLCQILNLREEKLTENDLKKKILIFSLSSPGIKIVKWKQTFTQYSCKMLESQKIILFKILKSFFFLNQTKLLAITKGK